MSSIISCVCCLESYINEVFIDFSVNLKWVIESTYFNKETKELINNFWELGIPRTSKYPILDKYEIFLGLSIKQKLKRGEQECQNVQLLIKLRNALVHYESEITDDVYNIGDISKNFEKIFKNKKISKNPFFSDGNSFFPDKCLSHGCAEWACKSTIDFLNYYSKLSHTPQVNKEMDFSTK